MTRALLKDTFREIKRSFGRFMSILIISMLGVAFFAGIRAAGPDMKATADAYFDENDLMDVRLVSNLGLTSGDVDAVAKIKGVLTTDPAYTTDMIMSDKEGGSSVLRLHSISKLNKPVLIKGRMPEKSGECLIQNSTFRRGLPAEIGETITLSSGTDDKVTDTLKTSKFTVVGVMDSPYYISYERGNCAIDDGSVDYYAYILPGDFALDYYTDIYLTVEGAAALNSLEDAYGDYIDGTVKGIEKLGDTRAGLRRDEIVNEANDKITDAQKELDDGKKEMDEKLADAQKKIDKGEADIADAERKYNDGKKEFDEKIADGRKQIDNSRKKLDKALAEYRSGVAELERQKKDAYAKLDAAKAKLDATKAQLKTAKAQLDAAKAKLDATKVQLDEAKARLDATKAQLDGAKAAIDENSAKLAVLRKQLDDMKALLASGTLAPAEEAALKAKLAAGEAAYADGTAELNTAQGKYDSGLLAYESGKKEYDAGVYAYGQGSASYEKNYASYAAGEKQYIAGLAQYEKAAKTADAKFAAAEKKLADAKKQLESGESRINDAEAKLRKAQREGEEKLSDAKQKIDDGKADLEKGKKEYAKAKSDGEKKIADAEKKIADGRKDIEKIPQGKWYVTTRTENLGVGEYKQAAERMSAIADVFPVIFFIIAALVCLNSMTRMVDEDRVYIGTLMGLGYSGGAIAGKYLIYGAIASVVGSVVGVLWGNSVFPSIIAGAYSIMYTLPNVRLLFYAGTAIGAAALSVAVTLISCYAAVRTAVMSRPAVLMRPKAPKAGRRVWIEKIKFIWSRLSFSVKVTMRNLFRYKKRFFMTVIGIGGSMALLVAGFGLRDSILNIVGYQYGGNTPIFDYQLLAATDTDEGTAESRLSGIKKTTGSDDVLMILSKELDIKTDKGKETVNLLVPQDTAAFTDYVHLRVRGSEEKVPFGSDSAVLTEKAATALDVSIGDEITVMDGERDRYTVKVTGITENYVTHYLYLSHDIYEKLWGKEPVYDTALIKLPEGADQTAISRELLKSSSIAGVMSVNELVNSLSDTMKTLNYVVLVLIVSAGLLAFLILYNLTNMNVSERYREIASLKVLGFYDGEVLTYVYRENFILTGIGIILGCFLGKLLHAFLIRTTEVNAVMFGRIIEPESYLLSVAITIGFALLVNFVMYFKLRRIDMIEALKTVE